MSNAREAIAAACQYISILKIENQNIEKQRDELLEALKLAVRQNQCDMLMTGEELRKCEAAIAKAEVQS